MTTTIQKWGNSQGVRLPKNLLAEADIESGEEVEVTVQNDCIVIRKVHCRKSIAQLFEGYDGDYKPQEMDWGTPQGGEVW